MEPEVLIIEITKEGVLKVFSTGVSYHFCSREEAIRYFDKKLHLFLMVPSAMNKKQIENISSFFFSSSKIESISVMYASVAVSLAVGIQNLVVVELEYGARGDILYSVDLVNKSALACTASISSRRKAEKERKDTGEGKKDAREEEIEAEEANAAGGGGALGRGRLEEVLDKIAEHASSHVCRSSTSSMYIRGDKSLGEEVQNELKRRGVIVLDEESRGEEAEGGSGYVLVGFPQYFEKAMPHNLLPESDVAYVGAVLTTMIKYFEIKEVNTREDFEAGNTKYLILN